jgi:hypothetical protein
MNLHAVALSICVLEIKTPPKALTGSPAKAPHRLLNRSSRANPQALLCLVMANVGPSAMKSCIKLVAASTSKRLL